MLIILYMYLFMKGEITIRPHGDSFIHELDIEYNKKCKRDINT